MGGVGCWSPIPRRILIPPSHRIGCALVYLEVARCKMVGSQSRTEGDRPWTGEGCPLTNCRHTISLLTLRIRLLSWMRMTQTPQLSRRLAKVDALAQCNLGAPLGQVGCFL